MKVEKPEMSEQYVRITVWLDAFAECGFLHRDVIGVDVVTNMHWDGTDIKWVQYCSK